jgi:GntR family transcriptional repressor for pyruvate dehydrogenase complex
VDAPERTRPAAGLSLRVAESIAADLRQRVLRSTETDTPLPRQEDLIAEYGVSGPSIREALRILEAEGLITVRRGKFGGAFVHKPNWASAAFAMALSMQGQGITLADLAESILQFEPQCAVACAERSDRATTVVPALEANLAATEATLGQAVRFATTARDFHNILVDFVPNETTRLVVRTMVTVWDIQEQTWAYASQSGGSYPDADSQTEVLKTHKVIAHLVASGDAAGVSKLALAHLKATQKVVLERFGDRIVDSSSLPAVQAFKSL